MVRKWYEQESYHTFLASQEREHYLPSSLYGKIIKSIPTNSNESINILDFGTGLGYAALSLSSIYQQNPNFHIFACDYQEELLDQLWHTLTKKKIKNITPFFIPHHSSIYFPHWVPKVQQIICSLLFSSNDNPEKVIQTIHTIAESNASLHIIDWNEKKIPHELKNMIPKENIMNPETLEIYLARANYTIERNYVADNYFFLISARVPDKI